jgi:hypothetical protein
VDTFYETQVFDYTTFANIGGSIQFNYTVNSDLVVERNNRGVELTDSSAFSSALTVDLYREHLLAVYDRKQQVAQTVGVPFLTDIPVLKYLFGTETKLDEDTKYFITVTGRIIHPKDTFAPWSGRLVSVDEFERLSTLSEE